MIRFIRLVLLLFVSLSILLSCERVKEPETVIRPVRFIHVSSTEVGQVRTFAGVAQTGDKASLSFRVGGKVIKFLVKVGDKLKKGSLIASLDPADFELKVQRTEASLVRARAQERNAEANYERVRLLYENRNASLNDLDIARADFESKKAAVVSVKKQLNLAKRELSYTNLIAPIDCAIASKQVEVNENIKSGQPIVSADCGSWEDVKIDVPERFISEIKNGMPVTVTFDTLPGESFQAIVIEVGVAATGTATTYPVKVRQTKPNPKVRSGMAAQVTFRFESLEGKRHIIVPLIAVGEDRDGRYVYVLERKEGELGTVRRRAVTIGALAPTKIQLLEPLGKGEVEGMEILEGLKEGELVVTAGVKRLSDGEKVKILGLEKG